MWQLYTSSHSLLALEQIENGYKTNVQYQCRPDSLHPCVSDVIATGLEGFPGSEQQRLWKQYQTNRQNEGTDEVYRSLTNVSGGKNGKDDAQDLDQRWLHHSGPWHIYAKDHSTTTNDITGLFGGSEGGCQGPQVLGHQTR
jgi:hypothetical protein